jgi:hypothetical protein
VRPCLLATSSLHGCFADRCRDKPGEHPSPFPLDPIGRVLC